MKKAKKQLGLILAAVLVFSIIYTPALAADTFYFSATPVQYDFYVDGESVSMWAYKIDGGGVYFKLRDLAAVLNGSEKQFEVSWDEGKKAVSLTTGAAYTPVGGELSEAAGDTGAVAAYPSMTSFYVDQRQIPLRSYIIGRAHYIMLSDLAANLMFGAGCDEKEHYVKIVTKAYYTDLYSFSLPESWRADGDIYNLNFTRSGDPVGNLFVYNYDPDVPISQFQGNHAETLSSEELGGFDYPAAKALIRRTQPAAAQDDSYVDELHIYILLGELNCAFDFSFDSAKVDEQTALEIAKDFTPHKAAIGISTLASRWAKAIQDRDGKAQYELMNKALQTDYYDYYDSHHWVTGVSSPWVNSWTIEASANSAVVFYENMTSTGFAGYTADTLTFSEGDGQLKISGIDGYHSQFAATGSDINSVTPGIFENVNHELDADIEFTNGWRSPLVDADENGAVGKYIIVQAGSLKSDPKQGVAVVCHQNKDSDQYIIDEKFLTPGKHGAIKIKSPGAKDFTMSVVAEDGYEWILNIYNGYYNNGADENGFSYSLRNKALKDFEGISVKDVLNKGKTVLYSITAENKDWVRPIHSDAWEDPTYQEKFPDSSLQVEAALHRIFELPVGASESSSFYAPLGLDDEDAQTISEAFKELSHIKTVGLLILNGRVENIVALDRQTVVVAEPARSGYQVILVDCDELAKDKTLFQLVTPDGYEIDYLPVFFE